MTDFETDVGPLPERGLDHHGSSADILQGQMEREDENIAKQDEQEESTRVGFTSGPKGECTEMRLEEVGSEAATQELEATTEMNHKEVDIEGWLDEPAETTEMHREGVGSELRANGSEVMPLVPLERFERHAHRHRLCR
ncbi:unnamed protein product [Prorocentrum cordatum]|uniref:Uncharacterized protein n=1 Tax=Prorocentrum cordatum TaxID=2364126 RepID=A0ABN9WQR4_9DINO|nr:unnamed protein product [Polarella glacialis]